jgi:hypothetical protein
MLRYLNSTKTGVTIEPILLHCSPYLVLLPMATTGTNML